jgi:hypothetical protein
MTKDEALKLALDWLESGNFVYPTELRTAIKQALAQPVQEPVAWRNPDSLLADEAFRWTEIEGWAVPVYDTTPPQPEERNFCPRCGKRTADPTTIHTCTPPQENT